MEGCCEAGKRGLGGRVCVCVGGGCEHEAHQGWQRGKEQLSALSQTRAVLAPVLAEARGLGLHGEGQGCRHQAGRGGLNLHLHEPRSTPSST
jgi:hypothetical protein